MGDLIAILPQQLVFGLALGTVYGLIALGYTMVYGVLEFINFAHSEIFAIGAFVGVEFLINFGGLGQLINDLAERYDLAGTYAAICFVILVSVLFFFITDRIERWLRPVD